MQERTHSGEELRVCAAQFARELRRRERAVLVTLSGELGAGKTTFVQGVAATLGISETVASPTFVIEKVYPIRDASRSNGAGEFGHRFERLVHIDAYRLKNAHELEVLGWSQIIADPANLILLEWPERVQKLIPEDAIQVRIDIEGDGRIISIDYGGKEKN